MDNKELLDKMVQMELMGQMVMMVQLELMGQMVLMAQMDYKV